MKVKWTMSISVYREVKICSRCKQDFLITDERKRRRRLCDKCRKGGV